MATKEDLLKEVQQKRKHYEQWHSKLVILYPPQEPKSVWLNLDENHTLRLTTLQISLSLYRYEHILKESNCNQWHYDKIQIFLDELNECPTKEPEKHLRYRGYYRK